MMHDAPGGLLRTIVAALEAARIPHMVVGSFASTAHGEPRTTLDLDYIEHWVTELGLAEPWRRARAAASA